MVTHLNPSGGLRSWLPITQPHSGSGCWASQQAMGPTVRYAYVLSGSVPAEKFE